jgi:hypothetical protein
MTLKRRSAWIYFVNTIVRDNERARMVFPTYPAAGRDDRPRSALRYTNNWIESYHHLLKNEIRFVALCWLEWRLFPF